MRPMTTPGTGLEKRLMTWRTVWMVVSGCSLQGMCLGGLFGYASGRIAPGFFQAVLPWQDVQPVGTATFLGATAGVLLGGGLGCFAVVVHVALRWREWGLSQPGRAGQPTLPERPHPDSLR